MKTSSPWLKSIVGLALAGATCGSASAAVLPPNLFFGGPGFEWFHQGNDAEGNFIWVAGDYWAQTFHSPIISANQLRLNLSLTSDLIAGALPLDVMVNNIVVGQLNLNERPPFATNFSFYSFPAIQGPDYRVELRVRQSVHDGYGSISLNTDGSSWVNIAPEPSSRVLVVAGTIVMLGFAGHRSRRRSSPASRCSN